MLLFLPVVFCFRIQTPLVLWIQLWGLRASPDVFKTLRSKKTAFYRKKAQRAALVNKAVQKTVVEYLNLKWEALYKEVTSMYGIEKATPYSSLI
jgi:hypothetical protein